MNFGIICVHDLKVNKIFDSLDRSNVFLFSKHDVNLQLLLIF